MQHAVITGLFHVDSDDFLIFLLFMFVLLVLVLVFVLLVAVFLFVFMVTVGPRGDTVFVLQMADRQPDKTFLSEVKTGATGDRIHVGIGVGNEPVGVLEFFLLTLVVLLAQKLLLLLHGILVYRLAGYIEVIGLPTDATQVKGKVAHAAVEAVDNVVHIGRVVVAILQRALDTLLGCARYTVVDDVDHTADGAATV